MTGSNERSDRHGPSLSSGDETPRVGRRSYLKLAGAAAGSVPWLVGTTAAGATTRVDSISNTVDAAAAGCDPTGRTPCDRAFRRAIGEDTLLSFPPGTYRFTEPHVVLGVERLGLVGEGDVSFVVPPGFDANLLTIAGGSELSVRGIDVDMTAPGAAPGLRLCARDRLAVEGVEFVGRGDYSPTTGPVANALSPVVHSPDGVGIVRNVVARNDGPMGPTYRRDDGRTGIRIGSATRGTVRIENCSFQGFQNGGAYVSETSGTIRIDGGVYRDNDVAGIRVGGTGEGTVRNARVEAGFGPSSETGPMNTCGIRFEGGGSGAEIEGCTVAVGPDVESEGAVVAAHDYGGFSLRESRIRVDGVDVPAVRGLAPHGGRYSPPRGSLDARIECCTIDGVGGDGAVRLTDRPVRIEDSVLDGPSLVGDDARNDPDAE